MRLASSLVSTFLLAAALVSATVSAAGISFRGRRTETAAFQAAVFSIKPQCFVENNWDIVGEDIASSRGPLESCCTKCETVAGCEAWTWTGYNGGTCWLEKHAYHKASPGAKSALFSYDNRPRCELFPDYDFEGKDIGSVKSARAENCCGICQGYAGCRAYTWSDYEGGTCWLKYDTAIPFFKPGVKSGRAYPVEDRRCEAPSEGIDFVGIDLGSQSGVGDATRCCEICHVVDQCRAYSWTRDNGGTYYFKSGRGETIAKAGVSSAQVFQNADAPCETYIDNLVLGQHMANVSAATTAQCCAACRRRVGCRSFVWSPDNGGTCDLKNGQALGTRQNGATWGYAD